MRIVLDTNVLVSGLLIRDSKPGRILDLVETGELTALLDGRILAEYREVLCRPKFSIPAGKAEAILEFLHHRGEPVDALDFPGTLPDAGDRPFLEVAVTGAARALITGNTRHFPGRITGGPSILTPAGFLALWDQEPGT